MKLFSPFPHLLACFISISLFCSCVDEEKPSPRNPVTLTIWHTMVEQMKESMDTVVAEFNQTVGTKEGITINMTSVTNTAYLHEKLIAAAMGDPGAPELPDMAVVYPNVAITLANMGLLLDLESAFLGGGLERFVPEFLDEGRLGGDTLDVLPFAKSTEVLFVNTVVFDRFAAETGARLTDLETFEGIARTADRFYQWSGGRTFVYADALFNFFMIGCEQLGSPLIENGGFRLDTAAFKKVWDVYFKQAVTGRNAIFDGYGNYLAKTGDIVCGISTSAAAVFYPDTVTYRDNTYEDAQWAVLPYPVFEGETKIAMQRGGGMCVIKSGAKKEYAAAVFLKWFTDPLRNKPFTAAAGYMPVQKAAFDERLGEGFDESDTVEKMFTAVARMQKDYSFYIPPVFDGFESMQQKFKKDLLYEAEKARNRYLSLLEPSGSLEPIGSLEPDEAAYQAASAGAFESFVDGRR
jgi:multiple sugar transport system substrate-binding protein